MILLSILWAVPSTVALYKNGKIISCISEERLSRIKNDDRYPKKAIDAILHSNLLTPDDLNMILVAGKHWNIHYMLTRKYSTFSIADRYKEEEEYWKPTILRKKRVDYLKIFSDKIDLQQYPGSRFWKKILTSLRRRKIGRSQKDYQNLTRAIIANHLKVNPKKIRFMDHHTCHAAFAYYATPCPSNKVLVCTGDAWGDQCNATINVAIKGEIYRKKTIKNFLVPRLYRSITLLLGMKPDEHEYKLMGLAGYGRKEFYQTELAVFRSLQKTKNDYFQFIKKPKDLFWSIKKKLKHSRFDNIASALQAYSEETIENWIHNCLKKFHCTSFAFGGGAAMNMKAMLKVSENKLCKKIFIGPSPADESLAIGACFAYAAKKLKLAQISPKEFIQPLKNAYLGFDISDNGIKKVIKKAKSLKNIKIQNYQDNFVADHLFQGKIIGRCVGRSEFGARSLGNRAILADPSKIESVKKINETIKSRDFWMPFAPTILDSDKNHFIINSKRNIYPYMTLGADTVETNRCKIQAGIHAGDFTCRPQVLQKKDNPSYYKLIKEFKKLSNIGALLNTSFNEHGRPIVQTAEEAFDLFLKTNLDGVIINHYYFYKK